MAAYVISEVEVLDPALIEKCRTLAQDSIARYDGQYIVRGGGVEPVSAVRSRRTRAGLDIRGIPLRKATNRRTRTRSRQTVIAKAPRLRPEPELSKSF
jgi:hypothetical protein